MRIRTRRPRTRDLVQLDGRLYRIAAEAFAPKLGFWLGRDEGPVVCERFLPRAAWRFVWDTRRQRWERDWRTTHVA